MLEMSSKFKLIGNLARFIPFTFFCRLSKLNFVVVYYHMVSDEDLLHIKHLYQYKSVNEFKDDLEFMLKHYSPINLTDLLEFINGGNPLPQNAILLTFDDGFREMHDIVAPILLEKGIPATFFINTDFIDNKKMCYLNKASILVEFLSKNMTEKHESEIRSIFKKHDEEFIDIRTSLLSIRYKSMNILDEIATLTKYDTNTYLEKNKPYLSSDQIAKLIQMGFTIGAHSLDHPLYSTVTLDEQVYQTLESMKRIKKQFNLSYGAFAFPHTDYGVSDKFFQEIYQYGLVDISFGTRGLLKDHPRNIQRVSFEKPHLDARKIMSYHYVRRVLKSLQGMGTVKRV